MFERQRDATRAAVAQQRMGFADRYVVIQCDPSDARPRRDRDATRGRRRFDLHVRLQEPLVAWYKVLGQVTERPVDWKLPGEVPVEASFDHESRYDLRAFDAFLSALEQF